MPTLEVTRSAIAPVSPDYREQPVEEGFDWPEIIRDLEKIHGNLTARALYLVVFESVRNPDANPEVIAALDHAAHEEAKESAALLHYYADTPDEHGRALSWCLWTDDKAAREAIGGPAHIEAMSRAREFYGDNYAVKLYSVVPAEDKVIFVPHSHPTIKTNHSEEYHNANI